MEAFSEARADAGIGFTYTFDNFKPLEKVKPLVIRFDMPLFLNRVPASDNDFLHYSTPKISRSHITYVRW